MTTKIVGAGISGLTLARRIAETGQKVIVYDVKNHIGGLLYDYLVNGFYVSDSGVHIFHTNDEQVFDFITKFGTIIAYNHLVSADVYGTDFVIPFPPNKNSRLDPKQVESLYSYYSLKQWGQMPPQEVLDRCKPKNNNSLYFFQDKYVGLPLHGWTELCKAISNHENIEIKLGHDFTLGDIQEGDTVYYSGRLDRLFNYQFGEMKYRSIEILNTGKGENLANVMNKSRPDCDYTRVINWRRCSPVLSKGNDVYGYEFSSNADKYDPAPHYIVAGQDETYKKYLELCKKHNIIPFGRVGGNKYINIDEAIKCALTLHL